MAASHPEQEAQRVMLIEKEVVEGNKCGGTAESQPQRWSQRARLQRRVKHVRLRCCQVQQLFELLQMAQIVVLM